MGHPVPKTINKIKAKQKNHRLPRVQTVQKGEVGQKASHVTDLLVILRGLMTVVLAEGGH